MFELTMNGGGVIEEIVKYIMLRLILNYWIDSFIDSRF